MTRPTQAIQRIQSMDPAEARRVMCGVGASWRDIREGMLLHAQLMEGILEEAGWDRGKVSSEVFPVDLTVGLLAWQSAMLKKLVASARAHPEVKSEAVKILEGLDAVLERVLYRAQRCGALKTDGRQN